MGEVLQQLKSDLFPTERWTVFPGLSINASVMSGFFVVVLVLLAALVVRLFVVPRFRTKPFAFQIFLEWIVECFAGMSEENVGKKNARFLGPYVFGASAYICFGILIELLGFRPVLADISGCLALALSTFVLINVFAIKERGVVGRIRYYFEPVKFVAPIRMLTDCAVPVSMTFRLFGSVLSGTVVMELAYAVFPWGLPGAISPLFTLFHAVIQSYVFAALSLTFISEAIE